MKSQYKMAGKERGILNTVKLLTILNLVLAAVALLKDMLMAAYLGTSGEADALLLAYSMNDIPGNCLFGTAVGAGCIPVFSALYSKDDKLSFKRTVTSISSVVLAVSVLVLIVLYIFKDIMIGAMGRGFTGSIYSMCISLFIIMLPTILLYPAYTVGTSAMQVLGRFIIPAAAPVIFNTIFFTSLAVGVIFKIPAPTGVYTAAMSITLGTLAMVLMVWLPLYKNKVKAAGLPYLRDALQSDSISRNAIKDIIKIFSPYLFILLSTQAVMYVERYIVSGMGEGYISGLNYAYRLSQFPIWVFVSAVGTVVYPSISRYMAEGNSEKLNNTISRAIFTILATTIPFTLFLLVFRVPVISVLFLRGAFNLDSLNITSDILLGYCLAIVGQSIAAISLKALMSAGKMKQACTAYIVSFIINISLDFLLAPVIGVKSIGYGAAAGGVINGIMTYMAVKKGFNLELGLKKGVLAAGFLGNAAVLLSSILCMYLWDYFAGNAGFAVRLIFIIVSAMVCISLYIVILYKTGLVKWGGTVQWLKH